MFRYQIRTPNPIRLQDVTEQLPRDAFHVLMAWRVFLIRPESVKLSSAKSQKGESKLGW
jgi:hypothetical protein